MARRVFNLLWAALASATLVIADEPGPPPADRPQWQRMLEGGDAKKAADLQKRIEAAEAADNYADAIKFGEELLALRSAAQGSDHWETLNQRWAVDAARKLNALPAERRAEWRAAREQAVMAEQRQAKGEYAQAEPAWRELLCIGKAIVGEKHPLTADSYNGLAGNLDYQGRYAEAAPIHQSALELRRELLGEKHPLTAQAYNNLAFNLNAQGKYAEAAPIYESVLDLIRELVGEKHIFTAVSYDNLAGNLNAQGKYAHAAQLYQKALDLRCDLLGENDLDTALSYNNLASNLNAQGKYAEAAPLYKKALDMRRERLGEKHPDTALSYNNLASNLNAQGKYAEAAPLYKRALDMRRERLGEKHPDIAQSYANLAANLNAEGKFADAAPLFQKALELFRELLGEKHPFTAMSYNNLAFNLNAQGKYAEAAPLYEKALELRRESLTEKHPTTATSYNNLALNLKAQGKYAEATPLFEKALELLSELLGENHQLTALSYSNLASNLDDQGKYAHAAPLHEKALDLRRELLGDKHPDTALSYNNLADNLSARQMYAAAEPLLRTALELHRELLGEKHLSTKTSYSNVAYNLVAQGRYAEAASHLYQAAASYEAARLAVSDRGLDRAAVVANQSPYSLLAAAQAQLGSPPAAWSAAETDLARGLSDESASRRGVTLTANEQERQAAVAARLSQIEPLVLQLVSKQAAEDAEKQQLANLQTERRILEDQLSELAVAASQRELAPFARVQSAISTDAALVMWVDVIARSRDVQEHWGCVVRASGEPYWERLPGTGPEGEWTTDDSALPAKLRAASAGAARAKETADLARKLHSQRIAPLEKHLDGVNRLFVVPVGAMAGVPVELLLDKYTVSYVPSGTFLARLKDHPHPSAAGLLALGDPKFPTAEPLKDEPLPPGGLLVMQVVPGGNAAQARLRAGEVLLKYAGIELVSVDQLGKLVEEHASDPSVAVTAWRAGQTADYELKPGKLGVVLDRQPAPQAIAARRKADQMLALISRGGAWKELPGTGIEVNRLRTRMGDKRTTVLTRSAASEQELEQLRASGKLQQFRYLHIATHGEPNNARSFESALILSQDQLSKEIPTGGGKYYDGKLTANEVLESWKLNADLVTLSACESALGRPGGGDGLLGFAQAFLLAGARSVCLSLWKVDDTATALLMDRFYQNLLGQREGLSQSMPKAEALAEAKRWLRDLTFDEALKFAADMSKGVARGKDEPAFELTRDSEPAPKPDDHPFAHPRYWAAFILVGDPN